MWPLKISRPNGDTKIVINGIVIECGSYANADAIMEMQDYIRIVTEDNTKTLWEREFAAKLITPTKRDDNE